MSILFRQDFAVKSVGLKNQHKVCIVRSTVSCFSQGLMGN